MQAPCPSSPWGPRGGPWNPDSQPLPPLAKDVQQPHQDEGSRRKCGVSVWWAITPILARLLCLPSRLIFFLHGHLEVEG